MRITIEIDEKTLKAIQKETGIKKKSPAVNQALADYLKRLERQKVVSRILNGETEYSATNDEIESQPFANLK